MVRFLLRFFELQLEFLDILFLIVQLFHQHLDFIVSMLFCVLSFLLGFVNSGFVILHCKFDGFCNFIVCFLYTFANKVKLLKLCI